MFTGRLVDKLVIGNAVTETADHGGDLRVKDRMGYQATTMKNDLNVLTGRMEHL